MARVLVTGMSGAGKSTLLQELSARGYPTVDTDYDGWELHGAVWDESRMDDLLATHSILVVSGTAQNQGRFYDRFQHVVYLHAPLDVLLERVVARKNNPYGKDPSQRADIARHVREVEPIIRSGATCELDGRRTPEELADAVEMLLRGS